MPVMTGNQNLRDKLASRKGQTSVEYLMLFAIVAGAVLLFVGPFGNIIASAIKTQKDKAETEYTDGEKNGYVEYYDKVDIVVK